MNTVTMMLLMTIQNKNVFITKLQRFYGKMEKHFAVQEEPFQSHDFEKDGCKIRLFVPNGSW